MSVKIGRAKGNKMPVKYGGKEFLIPLNKNYRGHRYKETSFSTSKRSSEKRAKKLREKGQPSHVKKYQRGNKALYVVYSRKS